MLQAAANPRNRVFVIFLDAPNVSVSGSHDIAEPLIRLINRILGPDDLVGIMTPAMSASEVVLARRTEVTEEQLRKHWTWGGRFGADERRTRGGIPHVLSADAERENRRVGAGPSSSSRASGSA